MNGDQLIRGSMWVTVVGLAGVAGAVSYAHGIHTVATYGVESRSAELAIPATADGLVYCGSAVLLYCSRHGIRKPPLAYVMAILGGVAVGVANVAHGISGGIPAAIIAVWPVVALLMSYELGLTLVRLSREARDARDGAQPRPKRSSMPRRVDATVAGDVTRELTSAPRSGNADRKDRARELLAQDPTLNGEALAEVLGVGRATGYRVLKAIKEEG